MNLATGAYHTLIESGREGGLHVVNAPNPIAADDDNILAAITRSSDTLWAVGHFKEDGRKPLILRHP